MLDFSVEVDNGAGAAWIGLGNVLQNDVVLAIAPVSAGRLRDRVDHVPDRVERNGVERTALIESDSTLIA